MRDEIEFAGTANYGAGTAWTQRFGELARVEKVFIQPTDGTLASGGGSVRTLDVTAASPDANQVTLEVRETTAGGGAWTQPTTGTDLSGITFYGIADGT